MTTLNYKHLRYFWMVAKAGSIARASEFRLACPVPWHPTEPSRPAPSGGKDWRTGAPRASPQRASPALRFSAFLLPDDKWIRSLWNGSLLAPGPQPVQASTGYATITARFSASVRPARATGFLAGEGGPAQ